MTKLAIERMRAVVIRHGTVDPIEIAKREDIKIVYRSMSKKWNIQALTYPILGVPTIILNRGLPALDELLYICHELTHALFDAPEMAAYLDKQRDNDVRIRQREGRAWAAGFWLAVMNVVEVAGGDWRWADQIYQDAIAA